jgi:hypothetical protein
LWKRSELSENCFHSVVVKIILINYAKKKNLFMSGLVCKHKMDKLERICSEGARKSPTYPFCTFSPGMNKVFFAKQNLLIWFWQKHYGSNFFFYFFTLKKPTPYIISAANYQISVNISLISPISVHSILWLIYMQVSSDHLSSGCCQPAHDVCCRIFFLILRVFGRPMGYHDNHWRKPK